MDPTLWIVMVYVWSAVRVIVGPGLEVKLLAVLPKPYSLDEISPTYRLKGMLEPAGGVNVVS